MTPVKNYAKRIVVLKNPACRRQTVGQGCAIAQAAV
jgi:hypothetical protein